MNEWVWINSGMILTGENWNTGRKIIYSVGGRWMNEYGAMVEWYWQGKTEVLGEKHYTAWVVDEWMSMEQRWNDTDRGKLKYWEKNTIECRWQVDEWVWNIGGMILTGENWSTWRKTLYSVGGRWMDVYGAMVEWYWQGKTEVLGGKHYTAWVVDGWMRMEQWWNDIDRGKLNYWERNITQRVEMDEWVWNNSGMILTGENWSTGRKTLYSVGGRWMNEYEAMVE